MKKNNHQGTPLRSKLICSVVAVAMALGSITAVAAPAAAPVAFTDNAIRIGVLTDMNSVYANVGGQGAVLAARMAIDDFGKKEVNGARIELFSADDQNRQDIAAAKTKEWIDRQGVDMIAGMVATSSGLGVLSEAVKRKKVVLLTGTASTSLTNSACSRYSVQWMQDTYGLSVGTIKSLIDQGKKTYFFITADYAFGHALEKDATELIKRYGGEVKGSAKHPFPGSDFTEQLKQARDSGASVILFANAGLDSTGVTKQAIAMGLTKNQLISPLLLFHQDAHALGLSILQNQMVTLGFVWNQSPEAEKFSRRFYERFKRMPDIGQASVYSGVLNYLRAVEAAGTDDGDAVMKQFHSMTINDAIITGGRIREDGKLLKPMYLLKLKTPANSHFAWDYYDIVKTIPAEEASIPLERSTCPFIMEKQGRAPAAVAPVAQPAAVKPTVAAPAAVARPAVSLVNAAAPTKESKPAAK